MFVSPSRVAADSLRILPRKRISSAMGRLARVRAPRPVFRAAVDAFCRGYGVDLSDVDFPEGGFATFDDFFTRRLRPGTRPVSEEREVVVSPADGRVLECGRIEEGLRLVIKGRPYGLGELIGGTDEARSFEGGLFSVIYLNPADYHRVHAPVDGEATAVRHIAGTLFPVNDIGLNHVSSLFARNERVVFFQQSPLHGSVITVMVGAMGVGRITVSFDDAVQSNLGVTGGYYRYRPGEHVLSRGDELGVFHLGSTVILLMQRAGGVSHLVRAGERIRMGEPVARASGA
jgi:phosphatidylserine decarboxylase